MHVRDVPQHRAVTIGMHETRAVVETKVRRSGVQILKSPRATTNRSDTRTSGPAGQAVRRGPLVPLRIRVRLLQCL
jgi:hypothetical protein